MAPTLLKKRSFLLILGILFLFSTIFFYISFEQINRHHQENETQQESSLFKEAVSLFETIIKVRQWNAEHGGVYVKQKKGLLPNPYLIDNVLKADNNNTLIKINPAWMTKQISNLINKDTNKYYKITSNNPINPLNAPDEFEREALNYFEKNPDEKYYYKIPDIESSKTSATYNFMGRLNTEKACLKCHAIQGYKAGDLRGGIRISIPLEEYN